MGIGVPATWGGCTCPPHLGFRGNAVVRYQVADEDRAIEFYTRHLGFEVALRSGEAFAAVKRGDLMLLLSGPGSSGSRPMPDGRTQHPGGWNRIVLHVDDLAATITSLEAARAKFRNQVEEGPGGKQIQSKIPTETRLSFINRLRSDVL